MKKAPKKPRPKQAKPSAVLSQPQSRKAQEEIVTQAPKGKKGYPRAQQIYDKYGTLPIRGS